MILIETQVRKSLACPSDGLSPGLGVGEKQQTPFEVYVLPFEVQDFPEPTAGEQQQPDCCRGEGTDLGEVVLGLGQVLGLGLCLV